MAWLQIQAVLLFLPSVWMTTFLGFGSFGVKNRGKPQRAQERGVIRHLPALACLFPYQGLLSVGFILASLRGKNSDLFLGGSIYRVFLPWKKSSLKSDRKDWTYLSEKRAW